MATAIHQYEDKLLDFAYGELPAPEASAVESHLKSCARCTQALDEIRGVRLTMSALPQEPAPANGLDSLLAYAEQAAVRNAAAPRAGAPWWRRMVAPLAGAFALTLVAVVAIKTQDDGIDLSAEKAALDAQPRKVEQVSPAPVAAAPAPAAEPVAEKPAEAENFAADAPILAQRAKSGKVAGASRELDRKAKEEVWDNKKVDALSKNNDGYSQALGETRGPAEERQQAQRDDLNSALNSAQKESKTRRETASPTQDFGNARGGYVQEQKAEESKKKSQPVMADATKGSGASTAAPANEPPPPPAAKMVAQKPSTAMPVPAAVAAPEPEKSEKAAPSLGFGLRNSGSSGSGAGTSTGSSMGGLGTRSKQAPRDSDDEIAFGSNEGGSKRMAKDVQTEQRDQEVVARGYLDAARSASNQGNSQEEVRQALSVLQTNVKGASRAEALSRLCTALERLGEEDQAGGYCDALLREYPTSSFAKAVANRRNQQMRPAPAPKASKRAYDYESADKAESAPAKPAQDKPAAKQ
jgi:hypothetical protein